MPKLPRSSGLGPRPASISGLRGLGKISAQARLNAQNLQRLEAATRDLQGQFNRMSRLVHVVVDEDILAPMREAWLKEVTGRFDRGEGRNPARRDVARFRPESGKSQGLRFELRAKQERIWRRRGQGRGANVQFGYDREVLARSSASRYYRIQDEGSTVFVGSELAYLQIAGDNTNLLPGYRVLRDTYNYDFRSGRPQRSVIVRNAIQGYGYSRVAEDLMRTRAGPTGNRFMEAVLQGLRARGVRIATFREIQQVKASPGARARLEGSDTPFVGRQR